MRTPKHRLVRARSWALTLVLAGTAGLPTACNREPFDPEKSDDLVALLEDGDLEALPAAAVKAEPGSMSGGGTGGSSGSMGGGMGGPGGGMGPTPPCRPEDPFPPPPPFPPPGRAPVIAAPPSAPASSPPAPTPPTTPPSPPFPPMSPPVPVPPPPPPPPVMPPPPVGPPPPICRRGPLAAWEMDDCNAQRTELRDSVRGFTAYRTVGAACAEGVQGQGVTLPRKKDLVYVPDQPVFTFENGVTVAAWVKATELGGKQTIFRKRDGDTSSLALMTVGKRVVFVIDREDRNPAAVATEAVEGEWTHVAATYDGAYLRLYINGYEAAVKVARGRIENGEGPLLIGNDLYHRRFEGTLDKVWFDTQPASPETINSLLCLRRPAALAGAPAKTEPLAPGAPASFEFTLTNNNTEQCPAASFFFQRDFSDSTDLEGWTIEPSFSFVQAPSGGTATIPVTVTSSLDADSGDFPIGFSAFPNDRFDGTAPPRASVTYVVSATGCRVATRRSLMIRDVSVVDDPVRTGFSADPADPRRGVWTFKHLMEQMAPRPEDAPAMVQSMFESFTTPQTINGFTVAARSGMRPIILDPWPRQSDGQLDLAAAPVRLLAIVNRFDLRRPGEGHAGEGRFVFGLLGSGRGGPFPPPPPPLPGDPVPPPPPPGPDGFPLEATIIVEYMLPASTEADVQDWARAWHGLGALPFPSEAYNEALAAITHRFAGRGAAPGLPNGSAMIHLRTNEISLGGGAEWELREFRFDEQGVLRPATIDRTPDQRFDNTQLLADFVRENEAPLLVELHTVPPMFRDQPFQGGAVFNNLGTWSLPAPFNFEARHKFAINTCNGCHSATETNTAFLMIGGRFAGQESFLSPFLTGTTTFDPFAGVQRRFNELGRRNRDLLIQVCPPEEIPPLPPDAGPPDAVRRDAGRAPDARMPVPPVAGPPDGGAAADAGPFEPAPAP